MTVYFSDNLFDFSYNLEFFIFHFLFLFFFKLLPRQPDSDRRAQNMEVKRTLKNQWKWTFLKSMAYQYGNIRVKRTRQGSTDSPQGIKSCEICIQTNILKRTHFIKLRNVTEIRVQSFVLKFEEKLKYFQFA